MSARVFVGNVKGGTTNKELDDAFSKYGPVRHVWIARNPPGFAYVEFEDARDAEDAVKRMPGREMRWRVEMAKGGVPSDRRGRDRPRSPRRRHRRSPSYDRRRSRSRGRGRSRSRSRGRDRSRSRSRDLRRRRSPSPRRRGGRGGQDRRRDRSLSSSRSRRCNSRSPRRDAAKRSPIKTPPPRSPSHSPLPYHSASPVVRSPSSE